PAHTCDAARRGKTRRLSAAPRATQVHECAETIQGSKCAEGRKEGCKASVEKIREEERSKTSEEEAERTVMRRVRGQLSVVRCLPAHPTRDDRQLTTEFAHVAVYS